MANSIFLDTNIVLDILVESRENHGNAKALLIYLLANDYEIVISEDMLSTIYYIVKDKEKTLAFLQIVQEQWQIVSYGTDVISQSLEYALDNGCDLEDTLQCFTAKENGCDYIITNDKKFVECGVEIVGYERFLK